MWARAESRSRIGPVPKAAAESAKVAEPPPFALIAPDQRGPVLWAVDRRAEVAGLRVGMRLTDARILIADLNIAPADPAADRRGLRKLAFWCNRFTPLCTVDGDGSRSDSHGLLLDIVGCSHLFGGEAALMDEIAGQFANLGIEVRSGLADTPGAARALARFGPTDNGNAGARIAAPGDMRAVLAGLPVEALGIADEDAHLLRRLGLVTVGALDGLPRASLARRFPGRDRCTAILTRLDQALGRRPEPVAAIVPPPTCLTRLSLPEPLVDRDGLETILVRLMPELTERLERDGLGVRTLVLWCYRVDGGAVRRKVVTARATRDGDHLLRLLRERLETVNSGFGIDGVALHADRVEPLAPAQLSLVDHQQQSGDVNLLIDRLRARLGKNAVHRLEPVAHHWPELAERAVTVDREPVYLPKAPEKPPRPFRLFDRPEPIKAIAEVPDGPPSLFIWRRARHRVTRATGPERIEPAWWALPMTHKFLWT